MEMYTGICKKCKKMFTAYEKSDYCMTCGIEIEGKRAEAVRYLEKHPDADHSEVEREIDIPEHILKDWVRTGQLHFADAKLGGLTCRKCGAAIDRGKLCFRCAHELTEEFQK